MLQRYLEPAIREALRQFPVVLITGARQVGKSTLAQAICRSVWKAPYLTLDDRTVLDAALTDPDGLIAAQPRRVAIDEVQRAPDLLRAIKLQVDRDRHTGRFLLTGSANVIALKRVSETLAGRIALLRLPPFSYGELLRRPSATTILDTCFRAASAEALVRALTGSGRPRDIPLATALLRGGYPDPALSAATSKRTRWFEAYRKTYVERDVQELQAIERLPEFGRLMHGLVARTGQVLNSADLGRTVGLPYVTVRRYLHLLEQTYQIVLVPPYFTNLTKRLSKAPKVYWTDTGMACHLLGIHDQSTLERHPMVGALVETWVAQELQKCLSWAGDPMAVYGWRFHDGHEVDFLIERGNRLMAVEVKAGTRIEPSVSKNLRMVREALGNRLTMSLVLYGGDEAVALAPQLAAIPLTRFFSGP